MVVYSTLIVSIFLTNTSDYYLSSLLSSCFKAWSCTSSLLSSSFTNWSSNHSPKLTVSKGDKVSVQPVAFKFDGQAPYYLHASKPGPGQVSFDLH